MTEYTFCKGNVQIKLGRSWVRLEASEVSVNAYTVLTSLCEQYSTGSVVLINDNALIDLELGLFVHIDDVIGVMFDADYLDVGKYVDGSCLSKEIRTGLYDAVEPAEDNAFDLKHGFDDQEIGPGRMLNPFIGTYRREEYVAFITAYLCMLDFEDTSIQSSLTIVDSDYSQCDEHNVYVRLSHNNMSPHQLSCVLDQQRQSYMISSIIDHAIRAEQIITMPDYSVLEAVERGLKWTTLFGSRHGDANLLCSPETYRLIAKQYKSRSSDSVVSLDNEYLTFNHNQIRVYQSYIVEDSTAVLYWPDYIAFEPVQASVYLSGVGDDDVILDYSFNTVIADPSAGVALDLVGS